HLLRRRAPLSGQELMPARCACSGLAPGGRRDGPLDRDAQHRSKRPRSWSRTPSPVTAALYSTLRAGAYGALLQNVGAQVADTDALVLAPDRDFGQVPASSEVRGVALGNLQELPDLRVVEASIVVTGEPVCRALHGGPLAAQARPHAPLHYCEPIALLVASVEHVEQ